jgi:hypothetical protein
MYFAQVVKNRQTNGFLRAADVTFYMHVSMHTARHAAINKLKKLVKFSLKVKIRDSMFFYGI